MRLAERRVRLGLVLSEIGENAGVTVSEQELQNAVMNQVRQYPGQEQQIFEFFKSNPDAVANLRAPIFEEKTVDHLLTVVDVTDKTVTREELLADDEDEEAPQEAAPAKKKAAAEEEGRAEEKEGGEARSNSPAHSQICEAARILGPGGFVLGSCARAKRCSGRKRVGQEVRRLRRSRSAPRRAP